MDVSPLLEIKPAPRAVFDRLATHRHRVRFQVRSGGAWQPVTWGQFAQQIRGVARWLVEHDLEPGDRVAIYAPNSVAWAAAALGAQAAGAVFVPIYPASTADQVAYILARGQNVFAVDYSDPAATAAAFTEDGWFCTGDVGRFTDDGFLQIIDRKKDILVNSGGKNIPPANIEAKFVDDPVIDRLVVCGDARPYLVAAVWVRAEVPAGERDRLVAQRIDEINHQLARHETIKRHFIAEAPLGVDDGTLTSSLKLRRKAVYDRLRDRFEGLYA